MSGTDELLADLWRLYEEQGEIPSTQDYREKGNYPLDRVYSSDRFDGFVDARQQAGIDGEIESESSLKIDPDRILTDIRGLWMWLDRVPSASDYREHGHYSLQAAYRHFDGWMDARERANVYDGNLSVLTKEDLIERLQTLYEELGEEPTIYDYWERVSNHHDAFNDYGGFTALKKEAGVYEGKYGNEAREVTRTDLVRDIRKTYNEHGGPISVTKYRKHGNHSVRLILNKFGSFVAAREQAGLESDSLLLRTGSDHPNHTGMDKDLYKLARFRKNRVRVLERDDWQCQQCGMSSEDHLEEWGRELHIHHILPTWLVEYPDDSIHAMENLVALCREHHHELYDGLFYGPKEITKFAD